MSNVAFREESDTHAYETNATVFKGGMTKQEVAQYYNKWASTGEYDLHLNPSRYTGPVYAAHAVASNFETNDRASARILDVAAGTGRLGQELWNLGFRNIDALDPSEGMLNKARERGVYTNFINDFIGPDTPVPCADGTYDGLAVSGGFGEGHIPVAALPEMIRVVKQGGIICIVMREEYLLVPEYKDKLEPFMQNLEKEGEWKLKARETVSNYFLEKTGLIYQFVVS